VVAEQYGSEFGKNAVFAYFAKPKCHKVLMSELGCHSSLRIVEFNSLNDQVWCVWSLRLPGYCCQNLDVCKVTVAREKAVA
jgi:hypothetical protein